jgi:hypothetical protein
MKRLTGLAVIATLALLGCGEQDDAPGGVTAEESKQLNEAAEMLDASPDSLAAAENASLGNGEAASEDGAAADELPVTDNAAINAN